MKDERLMFKCDPECELSTHRQRCWSYKALEKSGGSECVGGIKQTVI